VLQKAIERGSDLDHAEHRDLARILVWRDAGVDIPERLSGRLTGQVRWRLWGTLGECGDGLKDNEEGADGCEHC
jgi:hypothetical protein